MMWRFLSIHLLLLQTILCPGSLQRDEECAIKNDYGFITYEWQYYDWQHHIWPYSHLFSKLEEALLNNKTMMNLLRQNFMITENVEIHFSVQLEVVNGTDLSSSCDSDPSTNTFCPSNSSDYKWKLCNVHNEYGFNSTEMIYRSPYLSKIESDREKYGIDLKIVWLSMLHGNVISTFTFVPGLLPHPRSLVYDGSDYLYDDGIETSVLMTLVMERLDCNPSIAITQCVLSELLSWVSVSC